MSEFQEKHEVYDWMIRDVRDRAITLSTSSKGHIRLMFMLRFIQNGNAG